MLDVRELRRQGLRRLFGEYPSALGTQVRRGSVPSLLVL